MRYGITEQEVKDHDFYYSESLGGVCMPVCTNGSVAGLVVRCDFGGTVSSRRGTKYNTYRLSGAVPFLFEVRHNRSVLCLVEDILSAVKMGRHCDTIALLGVHDTAGLINLCKGYQKVIVYLDNDNITVRNKQVDLKNRIALVNSNVVIHRSVKDPKECTDNELLQIVN